MNTSKIAIILLLSIGLFSCSSERKIKAIDTLESPDKNYQINVWKAEKESIIELTPYIRYVSLTTFKNSEELTLKDPLYFEKAYNGNSFKDFEAVFPDRYWLDNRVFWMGDKKELETATNKIRIVNYSQKKINQVIVRTTGFFSIYDIDVNEVIEIPNSLASVEIKDVAIGFAAYYPDGTSIPSKGYGLNSGLTVEKEIGDFDIVVKESSVFINKH